MSREKLIDTLRDTYADKVEDMIRDSHYGGESKLNIELLNEKLAKLSFLEAQFCLSADEWYELIYELTPEIYDDINFGIIAA